MIWTFSISLFSKFCKLSDRVVTFFNFRHRPLISCYTLAPEWHVWQVSCEGCQYQMFERLNCRHGLICFALLLWTVATFYRLHKPSENKPEVFIVPKLPELPAVSKIEGRVAFLLSKEEAGFKPWWEQQLERRARVAETCDRSLFPGISGFNQKVN